MNYSILVTWVDGKGNPFWHICRGCTDYDAFNVYAMFCAKQTDESFFETHQTQHLGSEAP